MIETWEKVINPNFLNAEIIGDVGAETVATITDIERSEAFNPRTSKADEVICLFTAEHKPLILNKTNRKTLKRLFGAAEPSACVGKKIILYVEPVSVGGRPTTGIRIKEYSETLCESCGKPIQATRRNSVSEIVEISKRNTGKVLCVSCMKEYSKNMEESHE